MRSSTNARRLSAAAALAGLLAGATATAASAQAASGQTDSGLNGQVTGAGSGSNYGAAGNNRMDTGNGVAGTGMGMKPMKGNAMGTGNSVKGPPGQGIDGPVTNSTDTAK